MICVSFKFVNDKIFVVSPIITHWREYTGTWLFKSLPTRSQKNWYIENTTWQVYIISLKGVFQLKLSGILSSAEAFSLP